MVQEFALTRKKLFLRIKDKTLSAQHFFMQHLANSAAVFSPIKTIITFKQLERLHKS